MTNDEILQAAKEAGFAPNRSYTNIPVTGYATHDLSDQIKAFAAIIEKRTIERCAVVCESYDDRLEALRDNDYQAELAGRQAGAARCAAAIRKLGEQ